MLRLKSPFGYLRVLPSILRRRSDEGVKGSGKLFGAERKKLNPCPENEGECENSEVRGVETAHRFARHPEMSLIR